MPITVVSKETSHVDGGFVIVDTVNARLVPVEMVALVVNTATTSLESAVQDTPVRVLGLVALHDALSGTDMSSGTVNLISFVETRGQLTSISIDKDPESPLISEEKDGVKTEI